MLADPVRAPEYLALAAVEQFGPEAQAWIAEFRAQFPYVTAHHLARVTRKRFVKLSSLSGAVAGVAGGIGAVFDFGVLAWNQARMVIYLATIYGEDPTSRDRAAEMLMLQNVHKYMGAAQTALDVAARRAAPADLLKHSSTVQNSQGSLLTLATKLAKIGGMKLAKKGLLKLIPFASIPFGAVMNAGATGDLADRAIAMYAFRQQQRHQLPPATSGTPTVGEMAVSAARFEDQYRNSPVCPPGAGRASDAEGTATRGRAPVQHRLLQVQLVHDLTHDFVVEPPRVAQFQERRPFGCHHLQPQPPERGRRRLRARRPGTTPEPFPRCVAPVLGHRPEPLHDVLRQRVLGDQLVQPVDRRVDGAVLRAGLGEVVAVGRRP